MIAMNSSHLELVKKILHHHLPKGTSIWVFGSRARGQSKKYSDLDLAIDMNGEPIPIKLLSAICFDLEESDLPYKVDIVDWNTIDKTFQECIREDMEVLN